MFNLKSLFLCLSISTVFTGFVTAQPPPPASSQKADSDKTNVVKAVQENSLSKLSGSEKFSSTDGRFTVSLPNNISGFSALTPKMVGDNVSGSQYQWRFKEGFILARYMDYLDENFTVKTEQDFVNYFAGATDDTINSLKAKLISSSKIKLENYKGIRLDFELSDGTKGTYRTFLVNKRSYSLLAIFARDVPNAEKLINQIFDTLAVVNQSTVDEEMRRRIEQSTPPLLPQEPIANKEKSDAEDENLKGRVKTVTEESEDLSGTWSIQGRHLDSVTNFNEKGNRLKRLLYDSKALPFEVSVYGYIDGLRASKYGSISFENAPPPLMAISASSGKEKSKFDARYSYRYEYKYINGKLAEMKMLRNNGSDGMRYVYNHKGSNLEALVYDDAGKLNQKYLSVLDDKGNEIERTNVDVLGNYREGDQKYTVKYDSFDARGNWTKKTTSQSVIENGKQISKPSSIRYRVITYHQ